MAEVIDIAYAALAPRDADGNISGCVYMKPGDDANVYFQWNAWDEEANGPSPYLLFHPQAETPAESQAETAASDAPTESGQVRPPHFYYQGNTYLYYGQLIYALPEGYEFVAEVNNVGNVSDEPADFDGNVDGYVYMEPGNDIDTYFQFKTWDEEANGTPSPYLRLTHVAYIEPGNARPLHFYYQGNAYVYRGHLVYALPEGFEFVAEVNNVGDFPVPDKRNDFDGNGSGYVYMEPGNDVDAYFQWKTWDEAVNGESPYLYLGKDIEYLSGTIAPNASSNLKHLAH